jgi:hypothetical protein
MAVFSKDNLKNVSEDLSAEIIARFNAYDLLTRVMKLTASNLVDLAKSSKELNSTDKDDILYLAKRLFDATDKTWQKENNLWY